jgi:polygalacturonase
MKYLLSLLIFFSVLISGIEAQKVYNVLDYGAVPDGRTMNTDAIQKAVDDCNRDGGGTVIFPAGTYLTGTIALKDNVFLEFTPGSKLLGSNKIDDYPQNMPEERLSKALIWAMDVENTGIKGSGTIDGQAKYFQGKKDMARPFLLKFVRCKDVHVSGVKLQHPGFWTQHYYLCDGVTLRDLRIFAHGAENNDMIDIDQSRNVLITGIQGDSDDDGITIKSIGNGIVENLVISDCLIRTRTNAIKFGTDSYGGFRNVTVTNCLITPSVTEDGLSGYKEGMAGLALEVVDGGVMENVTISNIVI